MDSSLIHDNGGAEPFNLICEAMKHSLAVEEFQVDDKSVRGRCTRNRMSPLTNAKSLPSGVLLVALTA